MPRHLLRRHPTAPPSSDSPQQQSQPQQRQRLNQHPAQSQFQTPSPRGIPFPQLHPSSGAPIDPPADVAGAPEPVRRAAAAQAALFSLFGRGVAGRPQARESLTDADLDVEEEEEYDEESPFEDDELDDEEDDMNEADIEEQMGLDPDGNEEMSEEEIGDLVEGDMEDEGVDDDEDELMQDRDKSPTPLPSDLREISSLASWTVSTHKPGCGVAALRNPDHTQYWQSDGPQPHTLTLHFFKLVAVVKIRVYLDFSLDESYTPTKMTLLAGMGGNDLVEFATWEGEGPTGWVDVPLEGVGGQNGGWVRKKRRRRRARKSVGLRGKGVKGKGASASGVLADDSLLSEPENLGHENDTEDPTDDSDEDDDSEDDDDPYAGSVLKAMVIQMRVMENHQNGKDTHVRGFQVFARDDNHRRIGNAPSASADGRVRRHSARKSLRGATDDEGRDGHGDADKGKVTGLEEPDWMGDPVIR